MSNFMGWQEGLDRRVEWERYDELTGERTEVRLVQSATELWFADRDWSQVGPTHSTSTSAVSWAYGNGYLQVCEPHEVYDQYAYRESLLSGPAQEAERAVPRIVIPAPRRKGWRRTFARGPRRRWVKAA